MNLLVPRAAPHAEGASGCVQLVGLDIGSTTSRAVAATARLVHDARSQRVELGEVAITYRSPVVFTPFAGTHLDLLRAQQYLDDWLAEAALDRARLLGGGTLITGLAARSPNAPALAALVRERLGPCILTTAADPRLESWVAFMAGCAALSRQHPDLDFCNLDIGGGTTNLALGRSGAVLHTSALRVGARHIQVRPGSYEVTALSELGGELLTALGIQHGVGDVLTAEDVAAIVGFQVRTLEAAVRGDHAYFAARCARLHQETALPAIRNQNSAAQVAYTFTGGVGDLVYSHLLDEPLPAVTAYGDLGIDLAQAIARSPILVPAGRPSHVPAERARATVHGMLLHGTQLSGTTLFLPRPQVLPLPDLPILARLSQRSTQDEIDAALRLAAACPQGACLHVIAGCSTLAQVRALAARIQLALRDRAFPSEQPLVFLLADNTGKLFGHYLTDWGKLRLNVVVLDEVAERHMAYVSIGALRDQVVPVSFYGMGR